VEAGIRLLTNETSIGKHWNKYLNKLNAAILPNQSKNGVKAN